MGAPGPPVLRASAAAGPGSATITATWTTGSPAGATLVAFAAWDGNAATALIGPDSAGNVYVIGTQVPSNQGRLNGYYCLNALAVPIGGTLALTLSKSTNNKMLQVQSLAGSAVFGRETNGFGTGTFGDVECGVISPDAGQIGLAANWEDLGAADSGYVEDPAWTALGSVLQVGALRTASTLLAGSYLPTYGTSNNWGGKVFVFRGVAPTRRIVTLFRGPGVPVPAPGPVRIGYQASTKPIDDVIEQPWITAAHNLGSTIFRIGANPTDPTPARAIAIRDTILAANPPLALVVNFKNRPRDDALKTSVPAADLRAYQAQLASYIDLYAPAIIPANGGEITIENECNGAGPGADFQTQGAIPAALSTGQSYAQLADDCMTVALATYGAYRTMLLAAVDVCHSTGAYAGQRRQYPIGDCGISSTGFCRLRWLNLWEGGDRARADAYLALITQGGDFITSDLPNSANPDRPIFAGNPQALINLQISGLILAGAASSGIDHFNLHMFWANQAIGEQIDALKWARAVTGLPVIMTAVGQKSQDTPTSAAIGGVATSMRPHIFSIFGASNSQSSFQFADPLTGALNDRGVAIKAVLDQIP